MILYRLITMLCYVIQSHQLSWQTERFGSRAFVSCIHEKYGYFMPSKHPVSESSLSISLTNIIIHLFWRQNGSRQHQKSYGKAMKETKAPWYLYLFDLPFVLNCIIQKKKNSRMQIDCKDLWTRAKYKNVAIQEQVWYYIASNTWTTKPNISIVSKVPEFAVVTYHVLY